MERDLLEILERVKIMNSIFSSPELKLVISDLTKSIVNLQSHRIKYSRSPGKANTETITT